MTEKEPLTFITIRVSKDLRKQIRQAAANQDTDMSTYVKMCVKHYMLNRKEELENMRKKDE